VLRGESPADMVLTGGSVYTVDAVRGTAAAVAVRDGRIMAVGPAHEVEGHVARRTRQIDLRGMTVLSGFQDAHVHPVQAGLNLTRCTLHEVPRNLTAYLAAIAAYANSNPDRPWVLGEGWYMSAFPGGTPLAAGRTNERCRRPSAA
jgi:predicted amidohydrolase YtcJ